MNDVEYTRKVKVWRAVMRSAKGGQREELFGNAQSLKQSSLCCGTRLVDAAEEPSIGLRGQDAAAF